MRSIHALTLAVTALLLAACTEQTLPQFTDPQPISVPAGKPAIGPRLSQGNGTVTLSWMEPDEKGPQLRFSTLDQGDWQAATTVLRDENMFANWADMPAVTPIGSDVLLAHWMSKVSGATYAYQVLTAASADGGATWSNGVSPHSDATPTEHGFVSIYPADTGAGLIWLDGRETPDGGMTLRSGQLDSSGVPQSEELVDDLVCDCCQTDAAVSETGPIAVYRNRTEEEIRDIYVSRNLEGVWQPGVPLYEDGWKIAGCPVNGPAIDAAGDRVVVAWFTAANDKPKVQAVFSKNAGKSFSAPVEIDSSRALGHVGIALIDRNRFVVSWMESNKDGTFEINLRPLTFDGQVGPVMTVGRTSVMRNVPQMLRSKDKLIFAWTDELGGLRKVASVAVTILGFYD